jgi:hypothetical protein
MRLGAKKDAVAPAPRAEKLILVSASNGTVVHLGLRL